MMNSVITPIDGPSPSFAGELMRGLAYHMNELASQTADLTAHLRAWLCDHELRRSIMIIDDSPPALCALVALLAPLGVPLHAVTDDPTCASTLTMLGAHAHVVASLENAAAVWSEVRAAVVISDLTLGHGVSGLSVLASMGRGPRCVLVTSRDDHASGSTLAAAADTVQALSVVRTLTGAWEERLRDGVSKLLDDAARSDD
jgi:CheY-like chemotaxis protein